MLLKILLFIQWSKSVQFVWYTTYKGTFCLFWYLLGVNPVPISHIINMKPRTKVRDLELENSSYCEFPHYL